MTRGRLLLALKLLIGMFIFGAVGVAAQGSPLAPQPAGSGGSAPLPAMRINAPAQAGSAFTYQGRLTDGGAAANGVYDLQFKLFYSTAATDPIGTVIKEDVSVVNGLFTVDLDFGAATFNGEVRYLELAVRPGNSTGAFKTLAPRQALTPAPYAIGLTPHRKTIKITAPSLGINGVATRSESGIVFPSDFTARASAVSPMPEDWDGRSDFVFTLFFRPLNDVTGQTSGTIKFFVRISGRALETELLGDPTGTLVESPVTVNNPPSRVFAESFTIPSARFRKDNGDPKEIIHIFGIQREGVGSETYGSKVELLALEIAYTAVR